MAAKFEGDGSDNPPLGRPRAQSRTQSLISHFSQTSPTKSTRSSTSGSNGTHLNLRQVSSSSVHSQESPQKLSGRIPNGNSKIPVLKVLRNSVSDSVALRAAALAEAEKRHQGTMQEKAHLMGLRPPQPLTQPEQQDFEEPKLRSPPRLGTMLPHREQPPVAQHLNLIRPSSSASNIRQDQETEFLVPISSTTPRPSSATFLHSQIRKLQRQLEFRTEEVTQLKRQLEAQEHTDVGTLSQQLREARREAQTWRDRAEAAERRVKVFKRFTARLRGMKEAAAAADRQNRSENRGSELEDQNILDNIEGSTDLRNFEKSPHLTMAKARHFKGKSASGEKSDDSGRTEDAGVVQARIRRCFHRSTDDVDGPASDSATILEGILNDDEAQNASKKATRDISLWRNDMWMVAQALSEFGDVDTRSVESQDGSSEE